MELTRPFGRLNKGDVGIAGGKGASLGELTQAGISVPPGFVVLADVFDRFLEESDLRQEIEATLNAVKHDQIHTVEHASEKIQALIRGAEMPADISKAVLDEYEKLDTPYVAVRSSATAEDGAVAAWAGQLDTYLNTTRDTLLENLQRCWASLFTPRAIFYRFEKGLHGQKISVAVVVQEMIESEYSGIAFSVHPVTEDYNQLIIEAGFGLGEAIVSGQVTPDSYVIEKEPRRIIDKNISTQTRALQRGGGGNEWINVDEPRASSQVLTDAHILELSELVLRIESHYGFPCDIEWAFEGGKFYITQSRPITTLSGISSTQGESSPASISASSKRKLEKVFSREHNLLYFELWHSSDEKGIELIGETLPESLFITNPIGNAGSVWYEPERMAAVKEKLIDAFRGPNGKELLRKFTEYQEENWAFLGPYVVGEKFITSLPELITFYQLSAKYWVSMNSYLWETVGDPRMPSFVKQAVLSWRERSEAYSERANALEFIDATYPQYRDILWFLTLEEFEKVVTEKATDEEMKEYRERVNGCFMLNGAVYPLRELDTQLKARGLELGDASSAGIKEFVGTVAFKGTARGRVKIVSSYSDLAKIQAGDILVTPMTHPDYVPTIARAAGIITDEGGVMCHAAIEARELKKPCIIGTKIATQVLSDGDLVEMDADSGTVRILESEKAVQLPQAAEYTFIGFYKALPFAKYFWAQWCMPELAKKYSVPRGNHEYLSINGGPAFLNKESVRAFASLAEEKLKKGDVAYFKQLTDDARDVHAHAIEYAETLADSKTWRASQFPEMIEKVLRMQFYWGIGARLAEPFDEILKQSAIAHGIPVDTVGGYITTPTSPMSDVSADCARMKTYLHEHGLEELLQKNPGEVASHVRTSKELSRFFAPYLRKYGWIQMINWVGNPLSLEDLLVLVAEHKQPVSQVKSKKSLPHELAQVIDMVSHIAYLRQAGAEFQSIYQFLVLPYLLWVAKSASLSYREMMMLLPSEIVRDGTLVPDLAEKVRARDKDRWCVYTDSHGKVSMIDELETVDQLIKEFQVDTHAAVSELKGDIGCKGRARGTVRVILGTDDFHKMRDGDIIVTPMTTPDFVILMQRASAIVTDMGGLLCHAAIVSRELGKPCITGTKVATQMFKDGDTVEVNADIGIVTVVESFVQNEKGSNEGDAFIQMREREYALSPSYWNGIAQTSPLVKELYQIEPHDSISIYRNGRAYTVLHERSMKHNSTRIAQLLLSDPEYFARIESATNQGIKKALALTRRMSRMNLESMPNKKLLTFANLLQKAFVEFDAPSVYAWFIAGDEYKSLLEHTLEMSQEELDTISIPTKETYASKMEKDILTASLKNDTSKKTLDRLVRNYFWMPFGYEGPVTWDAHYFRTVITEKMSDRPRVQRELQEYARRIRAQKRTLKQTLRKYSFTSHQEFLISVLRTITQWTDERKHVDFQIFYQYDRVLREFSRRYDMRREELKYAFTDELSMLESDIGGMRERLDYRRHNEITTIGHDGVVRIATESESAAIREKISTGNTSESTFSGSVANAGPRRIFQARVKVLLSPKEIGKIQEGELLVASMTSPNYLPAMKKALGFITDEGGVTSHAAIISREMGKPCIIGTRVATKTLRDGDLVEVDTVNGVIRKLGG